MRAQRAISRSRAAKKKPRLSSAGQRVDGRQADGRVARPPLLAGDDHRDVGEQEQRGEVDADRPRPSAAGSRSGGEPSDDRHQVARRPRRPPARRSIAAGTTSAAPPTISGNVKKNGLSSPTGQRDQHRRERDRDRALDDELRAARARRRAAGRGRRGRTARPRASSTRIAAWLSRPQPGDRDDRRRSTAGRSSSTIRTTAVVRVRATARRRVHRRAALATTRPRRSASLDGGAASRPASALGRPAITRRRDQGGHQPEVGDDRQHDERRGPALDQPRVDSPPSDGSQSASAPRWRHLSRSDGPGPGRSRSDVPVAVAHRTSAPVGLAGPPLVGLLDHAAGRRTSRSRGRPRSRRRRSARKRSSASLSSQTVSTSRSYEPAVTTT